MSEGIVGGVVTEDEQLVINAYLSALYMQGVIDELRFRNSLYLKSKGKMKLVLVPFVKALEELIKKESKSMFGVSEDNDKTINDVLEMHRLFVTEISKMRSFDAGAFAAIIELYKENPEALMAKLDIVYEEKNKGA